MGQREDRSAREPGTWVGEFRRAHPWHWRAARVRRETRVLRHRWLWPGMVWSWAWTRGTFTRRFWTVVITGLAVYVIADVVAAWLT